MSKPNIKIAVTFILLLFWVLGLSACSFPQPKPQEGVWYCEELMIEIDFSVLNENKSVNPPYFAKKYNADGTYLEIRCLFDYGSGIRLCSTDWEEDYLYAEFSYRNDVFTVTTREDKHSYIFERIDD